ncbi:uncharacterized protein [Rutidosis leptorrhynchoides]|uniref:uncharacterized protein n=1 Tax=Rutidosis leptorrhynchoides TaxID=125765 RepID=UPI003A9A24B3
MDTNWMSRPRNSSVYKKGLDKFIDYIFKKEGVNSEITCPCNKCVNLKWVRRYDARTHILCDGFLKGYTIKTPISEPCDIPMKDAEDDMIGMMSDTHHWFDDNILETEDHSLPNKSAKKFYKGLESAKQELYPGCKNFFVLSFIVRLFHSKCIGKCNDKGFSMIIDTLREAFPEAAIPKSLYDLRKLIRDLGLGYEKIDACPNDYDEENLTANDHNKVPAKVLRYFPLIPRLQRLYMSSEAAASMRWHEEGRTKDGLLRHPADSPAWQTFDHNYPEFAKESRKVRLGLASDGFNPLGNMNNSHSTWPVVLIPYNLPPWMCMKKPYFMLTLLIPGPSALGNNIDVYLEPLVDELKMLWNHGVETYDSSTNSNFQMRAGMVWTISDFPAYANLSGWSTKGKLACPSYHKRTKSIRLRRSRKFVFMGHHRLLSKRHAYWKDKNSFDGTEELETKPTCLTGSDVLNELNGIEFKFGKLVKDNPVLQYNWKNRSIFFKLPYWKDNLIRHNLYVMHIEKNVCDSVIGTLMNLDVKTKDHLNGRYDLEEMGIRKELHPEVLENNKVYLPPACFSMNKKEKDRFCRMLKAMKVPDGYSANISRCIQLNPPKICGHKSHDNYILMQQLLLIYIRNSIPKHVHSVVIKLCRYSRRLCCKVLDPTELVQMENDIGIILCDMERIFPPSFFDIVVHLSFHLAYEDRIGGPVHYHWMYLIERYLTTLKSYVPNRSKPEGSISEGYLADECLAFCSLYFADNVETIHNKKSRNYDDGGKEDGLPIFSMSGRPIGARKMALLSLDRLANAHSYVLFNCSELESFRIEHLSILPRENKKERQHLIQRMHSNKIEKWFGKHVRKLHKQGVDGISEDLRHLANGPSEYVTTYKGYIVNGYRFQTKQTKKKRKQQIASQEDKEPFILASQAQQVFYVKDCVHKGWKVVIKTKPRDSYEMDAVTSLDDVETHLQSETGMGPQIDENVNIELVGEDIDGIVFDNITTTYTDTTEEHLEDDSIID